MQTLTTNITHLLTYAQKLRDAGEPENVINAHVEALSHTMEDVTEKFATKQDLKDEVSRLEEKIESQGLRLEERITSEVSRLEEKIHYETNKLDVKFTEKFNLLYWMMSFLLAGTATILCTTLCKIL